MTTLMKRKDRRLAVAAIGLCLLALASACNKGGSRLDTTRVTPVTNGPDEMDTPSAFTANECGDGGGFAHNFACTGFVFTPGPILTEPQGGPAIADAIGISNIRDGRRLATDGSGDPNGADARNMLMLGGATYDLSYFDSSENSTAYPGLVHQVPTPYCTEGNVGSACTAIGRTNYALGYNINFRYNDNVLTADDDIATGGFTVIKTTLNNDYLLFGVGADMTHQDRSTVNGNTIHTFTPAAFGSFVFGTKHATLPTTGLAAYAGFSQAYAQSSTKFQPFGSRGAVAAGGVIANGQSAMVFSFSDQGAKFEHGFIDLLGSTHRDFGQNELMTFDAGLRLDFIRQRLVLSSNFENPTYRTTTYATEVGSVDPSTIAASTEHAANPNNEYEINSNDFFISSGTASHLAFRLTANVDTPDLMDFTMALVSVVGVSPASCLPALSGVACYNSERAPGDDPAGYGYVGLYGPSVDIPSSSAGARDTNRAFDNSPTFAGGVWQYNGIVYVREYGNNDVNDPTTFEDDRVLGIVDLYGSLGGLVVDNPAAP